MNVFTTSHLLKIFLLALCLPVCFTVYAQKQFNVLDWKTDVSVNNYLVQIMRDQYAERKKNFEKALSSRKSTQAYIELVRKKYRSILGDKPQFSKAEAQITGFIQGKGYRIEKIVFESFPGHHLTANLYLPDGKKTFPAVLLFCGHEDQSKATESYQKTAIDFVRNGFIVFVIDPVSQSERYQLTDANGNALTRGGTTEHTLLNQQSNLFGLSTPADELWDNVSALDYLVERREVDTARIGCLGNSGGGMQTMYFAGYEPRIKIAAVSSFLMSRERALELTGPSDGCSQIPNEGKAGLELSDYLIAAAPKPILVLAGRFDFIDYAGTESAFQDLKKIYTSLGNPDRVKLFTWDDGHGISKPKREEAVKWFKKWLNHDTSNFIEPDMPVLPLKDLMVTASGQVMKEFRDEVSIPSRNLFMFDSLNSSRISFPEKKIEDVRKTIQQVLNLNIGKKKILVEKAGKIQSQGISFEKLILRKEGEIPLPVLIVYPEGAAEKIFFYCDENGKNKLADSASWIKSILAEHSVLVMTDLRGMGETEDKAELNDPKYYNREYRNAMLSIHIGKPLVGQRVTDILTVLEYLKTEPATKNLNLQLHASGRAGVPALHAAIMDTGISSLYLTNVITSYKSMLLDPVARNWYSYVIPSVLKFYDLPDLVKILKKRNIEVHQTNYTGTETSGLKFPELK
jgi:dienelactone hydrolase